MSDAGTKKLVRVYEDMAPPPSFLMSQFQTPSRNFHTSESVEIDVKRRGRSIAIAMTTITADGRRNEVSKFTNKEWKPPVFKEQVSVDAFQGLKRAPGQSPYAEGADSSVYRDRIIGVVFDSSLEMHSKIVRSVEQMSAQVLQTGKLDLIDENSAETYTLDFKPKATHFVTVGNDWDGGSSTKLADLESLAEVIRVDGKVIPNELMFGRLAWQDFLADTDVQTRLDNRRMVLGEVRPKRRADGSTFQGVITIGNYEFDMFTYGDSFDHPDTGADTPYITEDKVIVKSTESQLDLTYGDIPKFPGANPEALPFVPRRMALPGAKMMMNWRAWFSSSGDFLTVEVGTRPLTIPTGIDTFGCLDTRA